MLCFGLGFISGGETVGVLDDGNCVWVGRSGRAVLVWDLRMRLMRLVGWDWAWCGWRGGGV